MTTTPPSSLRGRGGPRAVRADRYEPGPCRGERPVVRRTRRADVADRRPRVSAARRLTRGCRPPRCGVERVMRVGAMIFATDQTMPLFGLVHEMEARGFESMWATEQTLVLIGRGTPRPGGELPDSYDRTRDLLLAVGRCCVRYYPAPAGHRSSAARRARSGHHRRRDHDTRLALQGRLEPGVGYGCACARVEASWSCPKPGQRPGRRIHFGGCADARFDERPATVMAACPSRDTARCSPTSPACGTRFATVGRRPSRGNRPRVLLVDDHAAIAC